MANEVGDENGSHVRLQKMQDQLNKAETRCKNLQSQLDQMKQLYGNESVSPTAKGNASFKSKTFSCGCPNEPYENTSQKKGQKTQSKCGCLNDKFVDIPTGNMDIKSPRPGACRVLFSDESITPHLEKNIEAKYADPKLCQETIHNMLSGITESVNQIADIFPSTAKQTASCGCKVTIKGRDKYSDSELATVERMDKDRGSKRGSRANSLTNFRGKRSSKDSLTSSMKRRKGKRNGKKHGRNGVGGGGGGGSGFTPTIEIFHKSKDKICTCPSDLDMNCYNLGQWDCMEVAQKDPCGKLSTINENQVCCTRPECKPYLKNYQLPTISSRMRQVNPNYLCRFNFRSIPFVASASVSPSHNLGINIQQVLNIIKTRQPISGISPTLAHNMGLAANKGSFAGITGQISCLLSQMNSQVPTSPQTCPLLCKAAICMDSNTCKNPYNYGNSNICSPNPCGSPMISPRIGSVLPIQSPDACSYNREDAMNRIKCEWDQPIPHSKTQDRCVCYPRKCKKLNSSTQNGNSIDMLPNFLKNYYSNTNSYSRRRGSIQSVQSRRMSNMNTFIQNNQGYNAANKITEPNSTNDELSGKIKRLRDVLVTLHNDFSYLNNKYNTLQSKIDNSALKDTFAMKQLEETEQQLQKKEKEIGAVVSLFKKIITIKQGTIDQADKNSSISSIEKSKSRMKIIQDSTASTHLTKLLRQVQSVQGVLKVS